MSVNYGCRLTDVTNGTATTFLVHEVRTGVSAADRRGTWALGMAGASIVSAGQNTNPTPNNREELAGELRNGVPRRGAHPAHDAGIGLEDERIAAREHRDGHSRIPGFSASYEAR